MTQPQVANDLTLVIPTLGRDMLRDTVRSIAEGTMRPAEVIISHQGRFGGIDSMLREFEAWGITVRYVHSEKRGAGAGRNTGIERVRTRFFAATDDDCTADIRWVEELVSALRERPREIVTGRVLASEPGAPSVITSEIERVYHRPTIRGEHFTSGNFGIALDAFRDVGPFDESELVRFCEDNEWSFRALEKGYAIRYKPAVTVTHLDWREESAMKDVYAGYASSQGGWYGRKLRELDLTFIVRLSYELMRGAKRWFVGSVRGDAIRKAHGRAFVIQLLRGVVAGLKE